MAPIAQGYKSTCYGILDDHIKAIVIILHKKSVEGCWEKEYHKFIEQMFKIVSPNKVH
jgi:hypothetical protein